MWESVGEKNLPFLPKGLRGDGPSESESEEMGTLVGDEMEGDGSFYEASALTPEESEPSSEQREHSLLGTVPQDLSDNSRGGDLCHLPVRLLQIRTGLISGS